jgi:hypothetical protein
MSAPLTALQLEKFAGLFKDAASFQQFTAALVEAADTESGKLLLVGEEVVGELVSPITAAERLRDSVLRKLVKNPATIEKLIQRLESEDLVD